MTGAPDEGATGAKRPLRVEIVSDVVCPWCYIGKRRLEAAVAAVPEIDVEIRWRPYMLDASIPAEGYPRRWYMERKFGSAERLDAMLDRVKREAAAEGLSFDLDAIERSPNTLDAHRLIHWAEALGLDRQDAVKEASMAAFFTEGRDVGDRDVLVEIGARHGFEAERLRERLAGDEDRLTVAEAVEEARAIGVTGVPCFILDRRIGLPGAQPAATIAAALREAQAM